MHPWHRMKVEVISEDIRILQNELRRVSLSFIYILSVRYVWYLWKHKPARRGRHCAVGILSPV